MKTKILVITILTCFCVPSCSERRDAQYATGSEAINSEEARRGWVPKWLPIESQEVKLRYDLDTNEIWIRFVLTKQNRSVFVGQLKAISDNEILRINFQRPRGTPWWPEGLIQHQPYNDWALNAIVYKGDNVLIPSSAYVAFDRTTENVYVWFNGK